MNTKKTKTRKQTLDKKCDKKRAYLVKVKAKFRCEYCGKDKYLNSHHIFTRNNYTTRYDLDNGICLCSGCHTMSSKFSAHKTPLEFAERVIKTRGQERYDNLKRKSHQIRDKDTDKIIEYLDQKEKEICGKSIIEEKTK